MMKQCMVALAMVLTQQHGAIGQEDLDFKNKTLEYTSNVVASSLNNTDTILDLFVRPEDKRKILTPDEFSVARAGAACSWMGTVTNRLGNAMDFAKIEMNSSNSDEVELFNRLSSVDTRMKSLSNAFCGFSSDPAIPAGQPSDEVVVRLVKLRNDLRWASTRMFSQRSQSRPRQGYWANQASNSYSSILRTLRSAKGSQLTGVQRDPSLTKTCFLIGQGTYASSQVKVSNLILASQSGRSLGNKCDELIKNIETSAIATSRMFCRGTGDDTSLTPGEANEAAIKSFELLEWGSQHVQKSCVSN